MRKLAAEQSILLDCIRGLSAVAVLIGHGLTMLPDPPAIGTRYPIQSYGVALFFILSGFLIAYNCLVKTGYTFGEYVIDRFARIFTAFVPALILVAIADPLYGFISEANSIGTFIANLLMLHHTPFGRVVEGLPRWEPFGSGRQFWTIAVEWWLYMLFGILFFLWRSSWPERGLMAFLFVPAALVVIFFSAHDSTALIWIVTALSAFGFCSFTASERLRGLSFVLTAFFGYLLYQRFWFLDPGIPFNAYDLNLMILTAGFFIGLLCMAVESRVFAGILMGSRGFWFWLSGISYSLYLTHQTLHYAWYKLIGVGGWWSASAMFAVSIVLAWAFTWAFDRHHKRVAKMLKKVFGYPDRGSTGPHVA